MPSLTNKLQQIYETLYRAFGPQHWWPGDSPFEVMVGAILTQNTNWANVEKAIANLKGADLLDPARLYQACENSPPPKGEGQGEGVLSLIRPAGYFNIKAKRLRNFLKFFIDEFGGDVTLMKKAPLETLRPMLLGVNGIGPETADSILLYALDKPIFVCDAYTYRIFTRHGIAGEDADYHQLQSIFMDNLPNDPKLFNEYHALIVRLGKDLCRPKPRCEGCPSKCTTIK